MTVILDGGMGHGLKSDPEIDKMGLPYSHQFIATTLASAHCAEPVVAMHRRFIAAGCRVLTTNNFCATPVHFEGRNVPDDFADVAAAAAHCAVRARQECGTTGIKIAGCLPPFSESYEAEPRVSDAAARAGYRRIVEHFCADVDLLLVETASSTRLADLALQGVREAGSALPVWVAFTLEDSPAQRLRGGEGVADAAAWAASQPEVQAVLLNCCAPEAISAALPALKAAVKGREGAPKQIGAYANGFRRTTSEWLQRREDAHWQRDAGDFDANDVMVPEAYARFARQWAADCEIIGGCCGIGPDHMHAVATAVAEGGDGTQP